MNKDTILKELEDRLDMWIYDGLTASDIKEDILSFLSTQLDSFEQEIRREERERMQRIFEASYPATLDGFGSGVVERFKDIVYKALLSPQEKEEKPLCGCEADEQGIKHTIDAHLPKEEKKEECNGGHKLLKGLSTCGCYKCPDHCNKEVGE